MMNDGGCKLTYQTFPPTPHDEKDSYALLRWQQLAKVMIAEITLLGVILIGVGLALQGWFILDLNKRLTYMNGLLLTRLQAIDEGVRKND